MSSALRHALDAVARVAQPGALLAAGIVYGTDGFFCIVGADALARTSAGSLTDVMGRMHEVADRRMPVIGATGLVLSLGCAATAATPRGKLLAGTATLLQIAYVAVYARYSKPINARLTACARAGDVDADAHASQQRWDRIVRLRFALMSATMLSLTFAVDATRASGGNR